MHYLKLALTPLVVQYVRPSGGVDAAVDGAEADEAAHGPGEADHQPRAPERGPAPVQQRLLHYRVVPA